MNTGPHNFAITNVYPYKFGKVLEVDTATASYFDIPWRALGDFGKRKFENLLVLSSLGENCKVIYI